MTSRTRLGSDPIALLALLVLACGGDGGGATGPGQRLAAVGRLERGATIRLVARDGVSAGDSLVSSVTVAPANAATVTGATLSLLQSGTVTVSARASDGRTLTTTLDVALPPIVYFDAVASGNRDLYAISLDGRDLKRLTTAAGDDEHPSVAGGTIAFASARDGNWELYALSIAGSSERRLTTTGVNERQPALAPGGTKIAYTSDVTGVPRVYLAAMPPADPIRLTQQDFGTIEADPTWSNTGARVAFVSTSSGLPRLLIGGAAGNIVPDPVNGSGSGTGFGKTDVEPAWSPDGNRIAFASTRSGTTQIFLLDLRTGAITQVTSAASPAGQPGWLPDGRLLFTTFTSSESALWWLDPGETAEPVRISTPGLLLPAHATGGS